MFYIYIIQFIHSIFLVVKPFLLPCMHQQTCWYNLKVMFFSCWQRLLKLWRGGPSVGALRLSTCYKGIKLPIKPLSAHSCAVIRKPSNWMKIQKPQLNSQSRHTAKENSAGIDRKVCCISFANIAITSLRDHWTCRQPPHPHSSQIVSNLNISLQHD